VIGVDGLEVVIGFAVGYLVGTRQGRQGLQQALDSAQAIWESPETKRALGEGLTAFGAVASPVLERLGGGRSNRSRAAFIGSVVDEVLERRQTRRAA
jgi:hypothetical protein